MINQYRGLHLDRFQREALEAIAGGEDVIVAAPTGAGKTLIAHYAIERALESGRRAIYTAPIKALSNQKYRDLTAAHPGQVGIATGDVSIDPEAPAVIMTTEIFRNTIFEDPARLSDVAWVVFDEVHYLDDEERGTVWEESLIFAPQGIRILALSATVSNLDEFAAWLGEVRRSTVRVVREDRRPVPLTIYASSTEGGIEPLEQVRRLRAGKRFHRKARQRRERNLQAYYQEAWRGLVTQTALRGELPCLFFLFSRAACEALAMAASSEDLLASPAAGHAAREEFRRLVQAFELDARDPEVRRLEWLVERGIAYHHAGILPALKEVIERLFSSGLLRLLCATETFALGVNMPARAVCFEGLKKFNGVARVPLKTREFQQMAGRAGRRGMDAHGSVFVTFDPNVDDPAVFTSLVKGQVEPVRSQFNLSYGTLLNLWMRLGERLYEACERSFANFSLKRSRRSVHHEGPLEAPPGHSGRGLQPGPPPGPSVPDLSHVVRRGSRARPREEHRAPRRPERAPIVPRRFADVVGQVRVRMDVLRELQYLDAADRVTDRGRFAMLVFGHELEMTELVWSGALDGLTPDQLAVVAAAVVFEPRKGVYYGGEDPRRILGKHVYRRAAEAVDELWRLEAARGVKQPVRPLDWSFSGVTWAWVSGAAFTELRELTDASDGDVVRILRQTIQLLRLTVRPLKELGRAELAGRFRDAHQRLKRDLVDAEWQLRRGAELEAERVAEEERSGEQEQGAEEEREAGSAESDGP